MQEWSSKENRVQRRSVVCGGIHVSKLALYAGVPRFFVHLLLVLLGGLR